MKKSKSYRIGYIFGVICTILEKLFELGLIIVGIIFIFKVLEVIM